MYQGCHSYTYLVADPQLVTVNALILVAKGTPTAELTKLKSVTAKNGITYMHSCGK